MNVLISPLYACNISTCRGCWITDAGLKRIGPQHSVEEWIAALGTLPPGILDICGGEPLLWPGLYDFCQRIGRPWAVTTNLVSPKFQEFTRRPLSGCLSWTCTYHPEGGLTVEEWAGRAQELKGFYPVTVAVLNTRPEAPDLARAFEQRGFHVAREPYEPYPVDLGQPSFTCEGGLSFLTIDPDGECYPCVDSQRAQTNKLGNIFGETLRLPQEPVRCSLRCNAWHVHIAAHPSGDCHQLKPRRLE